MKHNRLPDPPMPWGGVALFLAAFALLLVFVMVAR